MAPVRVADDMDVGLKLEYDYFYYFSFKNYITLNCNRLIFEASTWFT